MSLLDLVALGAPLRCAGCAQGGVRLCGACAELLGDAVHPPAVPGVDRLLVGMAYEGAARALVLDLKLRGDRTAAAPLVDALLRRVASTGIGADALTWVPGRPKENRRRGVDHAGVLAAELGRRLGLPVCSFLERAGERLDQSGLGAEERWANLRGAFTASECHGSIAVVDDLVTTGATAAACATALRTGGAEQVEVLAACCA